MHILVLIPEKCRPLEDIAAKILQNSEKIHRVQIIHRSEMIQTLPENFGKIQKIPTDIVN